MRTTITTALAGASLIAGLSALLPTQADASPMPATCIPFQKIFFGDEIVDGDTGLIVIFLPQDPQGVACVPPEAFIPGGLGPIDGFWEQLKEQNVPTFVYKLDDVSLLDIDHNGTISAAETRIASDCYGLDHATCSIAPHLVAHTKLIAQGNTKLVFETSTQIMPTDPTKRWIEFVQGVNGVVKAVGPFGLKFNLHALKVGTVVVDPTLPPDPLLSQYPTNEETIRFELKVPQR